MAENGDTNYFGEDLWRFMGYVNREKAFIQSEIDKRLDKLESAKEARGKIEEKLQTLQKFPLSEEDWDAWVKSLNKLHEEVGKLKVEEGYKDEELLRWKTSIKRMNDEVKCRVTMDEAI
ncbi:hypothetical protein HDU96_009773 [Phlyctochytrium bullatum]|nr:hypothetical protein HDU96_009773 [Phlyctochytrium bullatum]